MIDVDLQRAYDLIMLAVSAEDIFGEIPDAVPLGQLALLDESYAKLVAIVNPELYNSDPDAKEFAWDANDQLERFYQKAKEKIGKGIYGVRRSTAELIRGRPSFQTAKRQYYLGPAIAQGDIAVVYSGECVMGDDFAGKVVIKIVRYPADNDLAQNEIRTLTLFQQRPAAQLKHLPVLLDYFRTSEGQIGIILRQFEGYDFQTIRANPRYRNGIPEKHMVWILNRLLSAIGYSHSQGIVHCNIDPSHLMIRPKDHNLLLLDWGYAAVNPSHTGDGFKAYNEDFSAPEVKEKKPPLPAADLYSIGLCMIYILGGDIKTKTMPDSVDPKLQRFLNYFVMESPLQRAQDAWQMHGMLNRLVVELWGPKKFLNFEI